MMKNLRKPGFVFVGTTGTGKTYSFENRHLFNSPKKAKKPITPTFFCLCNEKFSLKWLFRHGFYKILWFGVLAKFNVITVNKKAVNGIFISYGTASPLQYLIDDGYSHDVIGYIFYEPIIKYTKPVNTK